MQLKLQGVIAEHLQERLKTCGSEVWGRDISFKDGEYVYIQAPSGTGKTTLVHLLYGLKSNYSGNILWDKQLLSQANDSIVSELRMREISIIFQDMRLFPQLTALENIEVKRGQTNQMSVDKASEWMERLGIGDKKNAHAATLSYGEQQRVAIIRALAQPFSWLLMDEPFSHLDNSNRQKAISLIGEVLAERNAGMILTDLDTNSYFSYTQTLKM